jgi:hypothetical protein
MERNMSFTTTTKMVVVSDSWVKPKKTPGPGAYSSPGAFGSQTNSNQTSAPVFSFGSSRRMFSAKEVEVDLVTSEIDFTKQSGRIAADRIMGSRVVSSKEKSAPRFGFSKSPRFASKVNTSPGPSYNVSAGVGSKRAALVGKDTSHAPKFGRAKRVTVKVSSTPGPASYTVQKEATLEKRPMVGFMRSTRDAQKKLLGVCDKVHISTFVRIHTS